MLSTFLISLREGLEASLIVGILIAYLVKSGRRGAIPYVWVGTALAAAACLILGAFLSFTSTQLSPRGEEIFAGTTSIIAVGLVTWMVFWMKHSARSLRSGLQNRIDDALPLGRIALVGAAFFAVAREGLETALFIYTNFKTVSKDTAPSVGLVLGLITAISLGIALYKNSIKLNLGKFFSITGTAFLIIAAGVLSHGINEFQQFGALPGARAFIWNWQSANSVLSTILDGTIGISTSLTWLQFIVWAGFLFVTLTQYLKPVKQTKREFATK